MFNFSDPLNLNPAPAVTRADIELNDAAFASDSLAAAIELNQKRPDLNYEKLSKTGVIGANIIVPMARKELASKPDSNPAFMQRVFGWLSPLSHLNDAKVQYLNSKYKIAEGMDYGGWDLGNAYYLPKKSLPYQSSFTGTPNFGPLNMFIKTPDAYNSDGSFNADGWRVVTKKALRQHTFSSILNTISIMAPAAGGAATGLGTASLAAKNVAGVAIEAALSGGAAGAVAATAATAATAAVMANTAKNVGDKENAPTVSNGIQQSPKQSAPNFLPVFIIGILALYYGS